MTIGKNDGSASTSPFFFFFRAMVEPKTTLRRTALTRFFRKMPFVDDDEHVLVMSTLWTLAMNNPNDRELPELGLFQCMACLIGKAITDSEWVQTGQNVYIPYYAAHIIGSYTISDPKLAKMAVKSGVLDPLVELLSGKLSWVEQRVAVRALGHLASYEQTFQDVAGHGGEIVGLAMGVASSCVENVYTRFVSLKGRNQLMIKYQSDLLTRGIGGVEVENQKAEEWATQLRSWSIYLISCFASKIGRLHPLICNSPSFLENLCMSWGRSVNGNSPTAIGLVRILCRRNLGRRVISHRRRVVETLCNLSRSSDDWQYMGIDCLLMLMRDRNTSPVVTGVVSPCLLDLVEVRNLGPRKHVGDLIADVLLSDYDHRTRIEEEVWEIKVERKRRENSMGASQFEKRTQMAHLKKKKGNERFRSGEIEEAKKLYTAALSLCPLRARKERVVLYSNRSQCQLLLGDPDAAISDTTRALSLTDPVNSHAKSLWRRSKAYDMKGLAKESLIDCITFVNKKLKEDGETVAMPYSAARMINKQMNTAGIFVSFTGADRVSTGRDFSKEKRTTWNRLPAIEEEPWRERIPTRRRIEGIRTNNHGKKVVLELNECDIDNTC